MEIKEINKALSNVLEQWSDVVLTADAEQWAFELEYTDRDLLNALWIFNHVAQNKAIKAGHFKDSNDEIEKMRKFRESLKDAFGFDTLELTNKVLEDAEGM